MAARSSRSLFLHLPPQRVPLGGDYPGGDRDCRAAGLKCPSPLDPAVAQIWAPHHMGCVTSPPPTHAHTCTRIWATPSMPPFWPLTKTVALSGSSGVVQSHCRQWTGHHLKRQREKRKEECGWCPRMRSMTTQHHSGTRPTALQLSQRQGTYAANSSSVCVLLLLILPGQQPGHLGEAACLWSLSPLSSPYPGIQEETQA